jgi:hypothetical protein
MVSKHSSAARVVLEILSKAIAAPHHHTFFLMSSNVQDLLAAGSYTPRLLLAFLKFSFQKITLLKFP